MSSVGSPLRPHLGVLVLVAALGVVAAASAVANERPLGAALLLVMPYVALFVGYVAGVVLAREASLAASVVVGGIALSFLLVGMPGYSNAVAALMVQVLALAVVGWQSSLQSAGDRRLLVGTAVVAAMIILFLGSKGAIVTGLLVAAGAAVRAPTTPRGRAFATSLAAVLLVLVCLVQLALSTRGGAALAQWVLSQRRLDLWSDALELQVSAPWLGHGPESFARLSVTALSDQDTRPAHSVLLETGAELGLIGIAVLAGLVGWGYWRLMRSGCASILVGLAAWTAVWLHSLVDYIADYPLVLMSAGAVLGATVGSGAERDPLTVGLPRCGTA